MRAALATVFLIALAMALPSGATAASDQECIKVTQYACVIVEGKCVGAGEYVCANAFGTYLGYEPGSDVCLVIWTSPTDDAGSWEDPDDLVLHRECLIY